MRWLRSLLKRGSAGPGSHLDVGARGERDASKYLRTRGLRVIARNLRTPGGEADLVCSDRRNNAVVLVEVKARIVAEASEPGAHTAARTIPPTAAINADKRRRLVRTAQSLTRHPRFRGQPVRIDVVTVVYSHPADRAPDIRHYENAVTADAKIR